MIRKGWFAKFSLWFVIFLIFSIFVFFVGFEVGKSPYFSKNKISQKEKVKNFDLFWQAWDILKSTYYHRDKLSDKKMLYGAIQGLAGSTNDPYTEFYSPEDAKKFKEDVGGKFGGIGAEIGIRDGVLQIVAPLKNSPAERAGLKSGDKIIKIDGELTNNMSLMEAVKKIRGEVGKKVVLTIFRDNWQETKDFEIKRELIKIPTTDLKFINIEDKKIAYLQIYNFDANLREDFYKKALKIIFAKSDGLILDLRNNPGGYLEVAVDVAGWFLKRGKVVVKEKFVNQPEIELKSQGNGYFAKLPLVVLINQGSASASEILAAALREEGGAVLVGQKSFGKGSVQTIKSLNDGSCLKITIALWLTPKGEEIEGKGIIPDVEVKENEKAIFGEESDNQLKKAEEILMEKIRERKGNSSLKILDQIMPKIEGIKVEVEPSK